ncbi:unnamed protein product [Rotaria magnacalcarata]|uniref:Aminoacyl-tRNA synthetase class Ia domain-containing protein n=1 Tax=Rotaria magnacalcarata TaxID=392030 RepID=A0A816QG25_9BILA|nr:unnamed protein product [Rotaria magnacalcarata]
MSNSGFSPPLPPATTPNTIPSPSIVSTDDLDFNNDKELFDAYQHCLNGNQYVNIKKSLYTFDGGPSFATGLPHYGHVLAGTIKDATTRWAYQIEHHLERRFDKTNNEIFISMDKRLHEF